MYSSGDWMKQAKAVEHVLSKAPLIDKELRVPYEEFRRRQSAVYNELQKAGFDIGIVYSDEHYNGDVPYLGGNTNISIEPVAGVIGKKGFHILAGLEGGYVAEQLGPRSGSSIHKVEILKLADEEYPVRAERLEDILMECAGKKPDKIALLTPRAVFPVSVFEALSKYLGGAERIVDMQDIYYRIKYEKSDIEMRLTKSCSQIADVMLEGMLAVLKPGMYETQVAQWGYNIALELGAEEMGFDVMVTSGEANRSLIGKALNRVIHEGDVVHLGVAPKRDGLTACERVSVVAVDNPSKITAQQKFWLNFVGEAFGVGLEKYKEVAANGSPAKLQEQGLVDYFKSREEDVFRLTGLHIDMANQKPYTGTHNGGYTECQEFYGAITLNSDNPLGNQIVTMLDVAVRGTGSMWNQTIIPGVDYFVVEKTLGKYGRNVEILNSLPVDMQQYVGTAY
ncbi:MAG: M24 family metallopeptidase [Clostridia bacterium]|nr:M24 family metallopeptidase [Clostridia bacterium]MDR3643591.1 M24 family metallopeptidase [Clostridia bacterium]